MLAGDIKPPHGARSSALARFGRECWTERRKKDDMQIRACVADPGKIPGQKMNKNMNYV
jgi:hypothetical protein